MINWYYFLFCFDFEVGLSRFLFIRNLQQKGHAQNSTQQNLYWASHPSESHFLNCNYYYFFVVLETRVYILL